MCLYTQMTERQSKEWLKARPKNIVAYKVVREKKVRFGFPRLMDEPSVPYRVVPPLYTSYGRYFETNKVDGVPVIKSDCGSKKEFPGRDYKAGYHLILTKTGAKRWIKCVLEADDSLIILKCEIPKTEVLAIGTQSDETAIVTKEFTFVEGQQYFEDEAICACTQK